MLNQWPKSLRENGCVYSPVTKAGTVRFTTLKPAIIQDKSFDAHSRGFVSKLAQSRHGKVKIHGLPGIEVHWLGITLHPRVGKFFTNMLVKAGG